MISSTHRQLRTIVGRGPTMRRGFSFRFVVSSRSACRRLASFGSPGTGRLCLGCRRVRGSCHRRANGLGDRHRKFTQSGGSRRDGVTPTVHSLRGEMLRVSRRLSGRTVRIQGTRGRGLGWRAVSMLVVVTLVTTTMVLFLIRLFMVPNVDLTNVSTLIYVVCTGCCTFTGLKANTKFVALVVSKVTYVNSLI